MKTQYEFNFEEAIAAMILSDKNSSQKQLNNLLDFHRNSSMHYDILCDSLFALATGKTNKTLWVTPSGKPYLADAQEDVEDRLLLTCDQVPDFDDDLKLQLETALIFLRGFSEADFFCNPEQKI